MLMLMSPIPYTPGSLTGPVGILIRLNPLTYVIVPYQEIFMYGRDGRIPSLSYALPLMGIALVLFIGGYYFFMKIKKVFTDYV
jgi:lipopolysaccharide transport system permease protein